MVVSAVAAVLGIRAATVKVNDNIEKFIYDLQRQGRWASWTATATAAAVATAIQAVPVFPCQVTLKGQ
jgi:hypothetical protein